MQILARRNLGGEVGTSQITMAALRELVNNKRKAAAVQALAEEKTDGKKQKDEWSLQDDDVDLCVPTTSTAMSSSSVQPRPSPPRSTPAPPPSAPVPPVAITGGQRSLAEGLSSMTQQAASSAAVEVAPAAVPGKSGPKTRKGLSALAVKKEPVVAPAAKHVGKRKNSSNKVNKIHDEIVNEYETIAAGFRDSMTCNAACEGLDAWVKKVTVWGKKKGALLSSQMIEQAYEVTTMTAKANNIRKAINVAVQFDEDKSKGTQGFQQRYLRNP